MAQLSQQTRLAILDSLSDGVYVVDRRRQITYWNKGAERLTGYTIAEVIGRRCQDNVLDHCDTHRSPLCGGACPLLDTMRDGEHREAHVFLTHKDGSRRPVWVRAAPLRDTTGQIVGTVGIFNDDSALVETRRRADDLHHSAMTDALTGLGNRRKGAMTLGAWLTQQRDYDWPFAALLCDVDHFKAVNDRHGHHTGDQALRTIAHTLRNACRAGDEIVRWGGEEFLVLAADTTPATLGVLAERLRALVAGARLIDAGVRVPLTLSIGASVAGPDDTPDTIIRRADALLYRAKRTGRNRVCLDTGLAGRAAA
jgi:diguanylate cyclase (GGDEF)-like protein/PAS domain S-box-containing protein